MHVCMLTYMWYRYVFTLYFYSIQSDWLLSSIPPNWTVCADLRSSHSDSLILPDHPAGTWAQMVSTHSAERASSCTDVLTVSASFHSRVVSNFQWCIYVLEKRKAKRSHKGLSFASGWIPECEIWLITFDRISGNSSRLKGYWKTQGCSNSFI